MTEELRSKLLLFVVEQDRETIGSIMGELADGSMTHVPCTSLDDQSLMDRFLESYTSQEDFTENMYPEYRQLEAELFVCDEYHRHWNPPQQTFELVFMPSGDTADNQQFEGAHLPQVGKVWHDGADSWYLVMHREAYMRGHGEREHVYFYLLAINDGIKYLRYHIPVPPIVQLGPWEIWP